MKKKLLLSLSLLFVLAVFCVPGMEAHAVDYVDDLPEESRGTLQKDQVMVNNYGTFPYHIILFPYHII